MRTCEICGNDTRRDAGRCTNNRCGVCHTKHCTPGGDTSPGHGRGNVDCLTLAQITALVAQRLTREAVRS